MSNLKEAISKAYDDDKGIIENLNFGKQKLKSGKNGRMLRVSDLLFLRCTFHEVDFSKVNFVNVRFDECKFVNCMFDSCNLNSIYFLKSNIINTKYLNCSLAESGFIENNCEDVSFKKCNLNLANFSLTPLKRIFVDGCQIDGTLLVAEMERMKVENTTLDELKKAILPFLGFVMKDYDEDVMNSYTVIRNALQNDTRNIQIRTGELQHISQEELDEILDDKCPKDTFVQNDRKEPIDFENYDLRGMNFQDRNLSGAIFKNSLLSDCIFAGCELSNCDFENSDLRNSIFYNAHFFQNNFVGSNLEGIILDEKNREIFTRSNLLKKEQPEEETFVEMDMNEESDVM